MEKIGETIALIAHFEAKVAELIGNHTQDIKVTEETLLEQYDLVSGIASELPIFSQPLTWCPKLERDVNRITVDRIVSLNFTIDSFRGLEGKRIRVIGKSGEEKGEFNRPGYCCVDQNFLYVSDTQNDRIQIFRKSDGSFFESIGSRGSRGPKPNQFQCPTGIAVNGKYLYVADSIRNDIRVFEMKMASNAYKPNRLFPFFSRVIGSGTRQFNKPQGICVDSDYLYVCDNNGVQITDLNGLFVRKLDVEKPESIAIDGNELFVTERDRVQVFEKSDGKLLRSIHIDGKNQKYEKEPKGICIFGNHLIVSDNTYEIRVFCKKDGSFINEFSSKIFINRICCDTTNLYTTTFCVFNASDSVQVFE